MAEGRMWTEAELRDLIAIDVSTGNTMQVLNSAISSGELTTVVQAIGTAANAQVTLCSAGEDKRRQDRPCAARLPHLCAAHTRRG